MHLLTNALLAVHEASTGTAKLEFWAGVGAIVGVVLFIRGFQMLRFKRLIMNTPASKVRSASLGLVEISGMAKGPTTIPAGITGEACYYYRAIAWQLRQSGKNREWKQVANESLYVPFFIEDPTGRLLIVPQGAEFDIERNFKDEFDMGFLSKGMLPANVSAFLFRNGVSPNDSTRIEEYCIKPDNPLFVFGTLCTDSDPLTWSPVPHLGSGTSLHAKFNFLGSGGGPLGWLGLTSGVNVTLSNQTINTGAIPVIVQAMAARKTNATSHSPSVWSEVSMAETALHKKSEAVTPLRENASHAGSSAVAAADLDPATEAPSPEAKTDSGLNTHPSVCLAKGTNGDPFMISWRSQREVLQSLAWKSAICIWGGPALTLGCLYLLALCLG